MKNRISSPAISQPRWLLPVLGCLAQALVFFLDNLTPLGFAHGVLYAPAVLIGLVAGRPGVIWLLTGLGLLGVVSGIWFSEGRLAMISDEYILLNRALGIGTVLGMGCFAAWALRLLHRQRAFQEALDKTASLLEVSSAVGRLGGWRVELRESVVDWSKEVFSLYQQPPGSPPDLDTALSWYVPEHKDRIRAAFAACASEGTSFDEDLQIQTPGSGRRWVRVVGEAVRDHTGIIVRVQGAIQDIEGHKAVQAELEKSRAEWRLMAESLPMMVWVAEADGVTTYMNQFAADYSGVTSADLLGAGWLRYVHPDDCGAAVTQWAAAVQAGHTYEAQFRVRRGDGAWRWHLARAVRVRLPGNSGARWYGTAIDVQAQRDEQDAHARLAKRLSDTMESVTDAIFVLDSNWCFSFLNQRALEMLDRQDEELVGRNVWEEFPAGRGSIFQEQYERCAREAVTVRFDAVYGPLGKHFEVTAYANDGGVVVYFRDVTDIRRIAEQLQQAQRMDSLGQLTGGVTHDFNNLLTVILGNAEVLIDQYGANHPQRAMVDMIGVAAKRGAEMTQRLLAFARKQPLEPKPADLNRLIQQFSPLLQRTLGEHIEIEMVQAPALWQTFVDSGQLEVALLNLAVNARDAMPNGGKLIIETSNATLEEVAAALRSEFEPGQYVMLAVTDSGHGMAPETVARVFEPFFTTKEVGKGTGLGLAMVYGFVKQSRGNITIYSEVGTGTTVKIYLPRHSRAAETAVYAAVRSNEVRTGQGQLVLLVEDDELVRKFARRQVESLGYRVIVATNGLEALRQLQSHPDVDLLFTDVVMPGGMSGRQLADTAREIKPGLPVLFTSGYTENSIVHHGRLDPGVLLLSKPYPRAQLAEKLSQALTLGGDDNPPDTPPVIGNNP